MTMTERILSRLGGGPASRRQIADDLGVDITKVRNVLSPLVDRGMVEKVGEQPDARSSRPVAVYGLIGAEMKQDTAGIVVTALAARSALEMAWA